MRERELYVGNSLGTESVNMLDIVRYGSFVFGPITCNYGVYSARQPMTAECDCQRKIAFRVMFCVDSDACDLTRR